MGSGYAPCACPDCDGQVVVVDDDTIPNKTEFCAYCEEAGCDAEGGEYLCREEEV